MVYEYYVNMKWKNTDENQKTDSFDINPENINALVMYNDYANSLMPILYAKLSIDKANIDKMVKAAKTASIYMYIYKIQKTSGAETANTSAKVLTQYAGEMSYFISKDINYNADIDYTEQNEGREDVFETFNIGLMFKECIESNKQTNNTTFISTDPFNAILSFMQSTPALIEQFTYNEPFDQLIVPPQDSLYKTVDFFNETAVFYDTPYRFYLEPGCIYLMSSSGSAVPKTGETYSAVIFNVRKVTDRDSNAEGLIENSSSESYYADINVKDTKYTIDNNTTKLFNGISTIIDPSKNNSITVLSQVQNTLNRINGIVNQINTFIDNSISNIKDIPSQLFDFKGILTDATDKMEKHVGDVVVHIGEALTTLKGLPTSSSTGGIYVTEESKNQAIQQVTNYYNAINDSAREVGYIAPLFSDLANEITSSMGFLTNFGSFFNGITGINMTDNIAAALQRLTQVKAKIGEHDAKVETELDPKVEECGKIVENANNVVKILQQIQNEYQNTSTEQNDPLALIIEDIQRDIRYLGEDNEQIANTVGEYKSQSIKIKSLEEALEPMMKQFDEFKVDIKSSITGVITDIRNIGVAAKQSLDNIINNAKDIVNSVSQLDFSIDSLEDLQKDISIVKDISKIGRLGISSFTANLSVSGLSESGGTGTKVVRVSNDNVNMVKNIKANIENNANILVLNKNAMDTSVLTPNKQYVIKNYDAHSDKNGIFLLHKKTDMFLRHGNVFSLNTQLELAKIKDQESSGTKQSTAAKKALNASDWNEIVSNARDILRQSNNGITLDNIGDVAKNAQKIADIYNKR